VSQDRLGRVEVRLGERTLVPDDRICVAYARVQAWTAGVDPF
jgi:hypothetical protein